MIDDALKGKWIYRWKPDVFSTTYFKNMSGFVRKRYVIEALLSYAQMYHQPRFSPIGLVQKLPLDSILLRLDMYYIDQILTA